MAIGHGVGVVLGDLLADLARRESFGHVVPPGGSPDRSADRRPVLGPGVRPYGIRRPVPNGTPPTTSSLVQGTGDIVMK